MNVYVVAYPPTLLYLVMHESPGKIVVYKDTTLFEVCSTKNLPQFPTKLQCSALNQRTKLS